MEATGGEESPISPSTPLLFAHVLHHDSTIATFLSSRMGMASPFERHPHQCAPGYHTAAASIFVAGHIFILLHDINIIGKSTMQHRFSRYHHLFYLRIKSKQRYTHIILHPYYKHHTPCIFSLLLTHLLYFCLVYSRLSLFERSASFRFSTPHL
jgi:hypothetical protein